MKTTQELRSMSPEELNKELLELRREQFNMRLKKANGSFDKTHHAPLVRKTIARVKTIMAEKVGISHVK